MYEAEAELWKSALRLSRTRGPIRLVEEEDDALNVAVTAVMIILISCLFGDARVVMMIAARGLVAVVVVSMKTDAMGRGW